MPVIRPLAALVLMTLGCAAPRAAMTATSGAGIVQAGHPVLRYRAAEVPHEHIGTPEFQALVARMVEAMRRAPGVGLAAPQLGVPLRVFVVEDTLERMAKLTEGERAERERVPVPLRVFVNPTVAPVSDEKVAFYEGCLSVEGYAGMVARYREVEVHALDEHGAEVHWRVSGWPARILQHESDHLDGVLYVERMEGRSFGTAPQVRERFGGKPMSEVKALLDERAPPAAH